MKLMHGNDFNGTDPTGWLMSEKYDGFRAVWDGEFLWSRQGGWFMEPDWFTAGLPAGVALDCELYIGTNTLTLLNSRTRKRNDDWRGIKLMVFDVITDAPVEQRIAVLDSLTLPAHCVKVAHTPCTSRNHLREFTAAILARGGEGAMIRKPASPYTNGRTSDLLKVKSIAVV